MKPEPLTKEKINIKEIMKQYRYLTSVRRQIDFRDGFNHALSLTESAVQWLLKEIEKLKNRDIDVEIHESARKQYYRSRFAWLGKSERRHIDFEQGIMFALIEVESLIKKAFEGVI